MAEKVDSRTDADEKSDQERRFTTLRRAIAVAAREQGADPEQNLRLRLAIRRAEAANMPEEDIERARQRGSGSSEVRGPELEQVTYEGYGPDGVAVFVEAITEDRGRTEGELSEIFQRHGGSLGEEGCVAWQFDRRGLVKVDARGVDDQDEFMLEVIEMGADELREPLYEQGEAGRTSAWRVYCEYPELRDLAERLSEAGYDIIGAEPVREATQTVELSSDRARNFMSFYEEVSMHEDVQNVYANWDIA